MVCKLHVMLRLAKFAFFLAVVLISVSLNAADRPRDVTVHLDYERGPGARQCPAEEALTNEVRAELGVERFAEAGPWRLHATVNRKKNGAFVATADLFDSDGALVVALGELVSFDCPTLVRAVAVWTAVKLTDPPLPPPLPATLPSVAPTTTPLLLSPIPTSLPTAAPALPSPPPLPAVPLPLFRTRLGAATGVEVGVGPTPTPLFALNLALQSTTARIISLAVEVRTDLPLPATVQGGTRVHALVLSGSVLACVHPFEGGVLYLCPMFTTGTLVGGGRFVPTSGSGLYSAGGGRLGVAIPFASQRLTFNLAGDLLGTVHPLLMRYNERVVWQTGRSAGAIAAGIETFS